MQRIEIYTSPFCGYCSHAKHLLQRKQLTYVEYDISTDPALRSQMLERSNGRTSVPQIFIADQGIGGCDELYQLEHENKLDAMMDNTNSSE